MNESIFATPEFYSTTLHLISFISIPVHIFGAYCILFQTPELMNSVKWSMLNLHFWSSCLDISVSLLTQPYLLKSTWSGIPLGVLKYLGVSLSIQSYLVTTSFTLTSVAIITIFENRFYLVFAENTWWKYGRMVFLTSNYILALLYFVPTVIAVPDQKSARDQIFRNFPEFGVYDSPENPIFVLVAHNDNSVSIRQIIMEAFLFFEAIGLVGILYWKMKNVEKDMKLSEATAKLQRAFLKSICIQVSLPLFIILIPSIISIFSGILEISTQSLNNLVYITFSVHGLTSTLIMLSIQKPYREFCLNILRPKYVSSRKNNTIFHSKIKNPTLF